MIQFVIKFLCVFYVAVVVNTRTINSNSEDGKFGDIFSFLNRKDTTDPKNYKREAKYNEMDQILANVTENINTLKEKYGIDKYKTLLPMLDKIIYEYNAPKTTTKMTTVATTENGDFLGTEQIEALLNDIKARAIEMVAAQSPSVTDIISNTVTEATFEADPILTHIEMSSPGYALTTFVCLNNIEHSMNIENKRTANDTNTIVISDNDHKHKVSVRSVKEDAYTIAQNVEDMLQKELKSIYKKVKNKVAKDFNKEVHAAKSTLKCESSKVMDKVSKKVKGVMKTSSLTTSRKATTAPRHYREFKMTKAMTKSTNQPDTTTPTSTIDDFAMLTLYEQILAKTHEDNVMKMLTTSKKRKVDEVIRLSKRNPETLTDLTLKEDIKKMNDGEEPIPDFDYNNDITFPQSPSDYLSDLDTLISKSIQTTANSIATQTEAAPMEDTSLEGLSEKIAYKDYVNGYKSYLNFQKEQAKQNFSALVKYQAHRHHKVDDIGKFILNKIPQIPLRRKRYFFDDSDMDEQDISTKSDDSWFKKHFYMFIDSGPQKKYHTSETVEFKDVTEARRGYADSTEKLNLNTVNPEAERTSDADQTVEINLDELSKALDDSRVASGVSILKNAGNVVNSGSNQFKSVSPIRKSNKYKVEDGGITIQVYSPNIISKFFGKGRRNTAKDKLVYEDNTLKYDDDDTFLFNSDLDRYRRNAKKQNKATDKEKNNNLSQTTILHKQDKKHDKTNSNEKVGCVSIVTQPTAIVNLHKSNVKGNKIKKLLSKLHFYKRNNKNKKEKRHCTRVQRFNPMKKLRDLFKIRQDGKAMDNNNDVIADYDMITSHIDTFKPVKYDKIPSIEELRNQVPNISGIFPTNQPEKMVVDKPKIDRNNVKKVNTLLTALDNSLSTKSHSVSPSTGRDVTLQRSKQQPKVNTLKDIAVADGILNVNVKTLPRFKELYTPVKLENMRHEITEIQTKLSTDDELSDFLTSPKPKVKEKLKTYDNTYDKEYDKLFNNDITIKAKLTQIATYPIINKPQYKHNFTEMIPVGDKTKFYEFVDNNSYLNIHETDKNAHEETYPTQNTPFLDAQFSTITKPNVMAATPPNEFVLKTLDYIKNFNSKLPEHISKYKTYPDYFHDLVMWNSDILSYDKVSSPTWQDFLKNMESDQEFTTPSLRDIQREVNEMKEHFIGNEFSLRDEGNVKSKAAVETTPHILSSPKYVAKADNIKVAVASKTMKTLPNPADIFENLYNVPKNEPIKYNYVKSQDIIDVLNKLYNQKPYKPNTESDWKINEGPPRSTSDTNVFELDTTRMFHADSLNFVSGNSYPMKISKNSLRSYNNKKQETHPKSTVNQQPKQYYNTPLPMRNEQFEKFLKENQLDVESVTLPMIDMPKITQTWHSKINPLAKTINFDEDVKDVTTPKTKINDNTETTKVGYKNGINEEMVEIGDKSYPDNQIDYLNDLENDLFNDYRDNVNERQKRSSLNNILTENALVSKEYLQKITHNLNDMFEKNLKVSTDVMNLNSVTPNENEVEITIINFDDADKKLESNKPVTGSQQELIKVDSTKNKDKTLAHMATSDSTKTQATSETENNKQLYDRNLEYKDDGTETSLSNDAQTNIKADQEIIDKIPIVNLNKLTNKMDANYKDKQGDLPKRVQISSHSYKYDVLYNVPDKQGNAHDEKDDIYIKENTTPVHSLNIKRDYNYEESNNSDFSVTRSVNIISNRIHQIMVVVDAVNAVNDFTRPDIPIHIDLPTYYAPNTEIDTRKLLPASLKTSWTDLVLKYISGIALIEMLNKLGVLKGGLNLTDGLDVTLDHDQVLNIDGVMADDGILRAKRAAKTTKRHTFSQTIHFTRDMKKRNKRLFKILPVIKEKLRMLAKRKSTTRMMTPAKPMELLKGIPTDKNLANIGATTEFNARNERNFKAPDLSYDLFDYKCDSNYENKKAPETTWQPIFIITNKEMDKSKTKPKVKPIDDEGVYVEEYDNHNYYEPGTKANKATKKTKTIRYQIDKNIEDNNQKVTDFNSYSKLKRDVSQETFTAKNVAAFEVIVDLMKNTPKFEGKNMIKMVSHKNVATQRTKPRKNTNEAMEHITNSIQVHIAIPYDVPDKKRSIDPLKVRKVFSAKMATPVDLEYQIHSIEDNTATTAESPNLDYGFSPGMYLILEDENALKNCFTLKHIQDSSIQMRNTDEVTKKPELVKLSKEFVAAVNKHLIELYNNITAANEDKNNKKKHTVKRRETGWNKIKKLFGHDRVCNCKCKENKTMCRACAASDAVIRELTFEFDNLAKYMSDHCTEIQTFFWMNPSGGRKLRDAVRRIDRSLNDYYKRVKGKCQGRTCKTFATYIDKRDFNKSKKISKNYIGKSLTDDLESINTIFGLSSNFIPYDETLKEKGSEFVRTATNCITLKPISKRSSISNNAKENYDKDVYTLDNISVNIMCSPEVSTVLTHTRPVSLIESMTTEKDNSNIFLDYDPNKRNCKKYKLKNLFRRKSKVKLDKLLTYDTQVTASDTFKREAIYKQIESPIIADTGGSFWHNYLSKGNVDVSNDNRKPNVEISVEQTNCVKTPASTDQARVKDSDSLKNKLKSIYKSKNKVTLSTARSEITDSLSYNMNELFKLIGTIQDVEDPSNTFTDPTIVTQYTTEHKTKKTKAKKHKKTHKTPKCKILHKHKPKKINMTTDIKNTPMDTFNTTFGNTSSPVNLNEVKTTTQSKATTNKYNSFPIEEFTPSLKETRTTEKQPTTAKKNLFNKIKMATLGFLSKIGKGNYVFDQTTAHALTEDEIQTRTITTAKTSTIDDKKSSKQDSNVISDVTTKFNPTILIINDDTHDSAIKEKSKYKNILLSLINYERGKLDKEKQDIDEEFDKGMDEANLVENVSHRDVDDIERILLGLKLKPVTNTKTTQENRDYDIFQSLKSIRPQLEKLEIPAPPSIHSEPGLLEKLTHKFKIKIVEKDAAKPTSDRVTTEKRGNRKWLHVEEADPIKISNSNVLNKRQSTDLNKYDNDETRRRSKKPRKRSDSYKNSDSNTHLEDSNRKERITKDRRVETRTKFDSFIRQENGIYRLKRNTDTTNVIVELTDTRKEDSDSTNALRNPETVGYLKKERRKRKRSSSAERIRSNSRLSMWMQHNTGFFLATATCLYIVFALFAAVVNWLFRR